MSLLNRRAGRWGIAAAIATGGLVVLVVALRFGHAVDARTLPGLTGPGPWTDWGLPAATLAGRLAAVVAIGTAGAAAFAAPGTPDTGRRVRLGAVGRYWTRISAVAACMWAAATLAALALTASDLAAVPLPALPAGSLLRVATGTGTGRPLLATALLAATAAVAAITARTLTHAAATATVAVAGLLPATFTGHGASAGNHQLATSSLLIHVVAATVWAGGLVALLLARPLAPTVLATAVRRYSLVAAVCLAAVAGSGVTTAAARLPDWAALTTTRYGLLVIAKTAALILLAALGWLHRRRTLPSLATARPRAFARLATVEVAVFAMTFGLAVALSRTPTPATPIPGPGTDLLGYPMPAPVSAAALITKWLPEPLFAAAAIAAAAVYCLGVWRLRRRGDAWPVSRVALWLAGCALLLVVTNSGLARYGPVLLSVHMVQHMALTMLVPILLVLGAPITLALRALKPGPDPGMPGPREWLTTALHAHTTRLAAHPLVATAVFVGSLYAMYFTRLYETALRSHPAHLAMYLHLLATGYLFFWVLIGTDRPPRPLAHPLRILLLLAAMTLHAFFGLTLMQTGNVLADAWYTALARPWGPTPLTDQHTAGGIAWAFGELPALAVALILVAQWIRADQRDQTRADRHGQAAHDAYNEYLSQLAAQDPHRR